jgi:hypothetical protein
MSLVKQNGIVIIICDKCKDTSTASASTYNDLFYDEGWALNRGRKYEHLCYSCLPSKSRKAIAFVKKFLTSEQQDNGE